MKLHNIHYAKLKRLPARHPNRSKRQVFPIPAHRFREARLAAGMGLVACAELLRISERTIRNWETGQSRIPFPAYKLLRLLKGGKVLGSQWRDFYVYGDTLVTPEGHRFHFSELAWWSLLVRRAHAFTELRQQGQDERGSARGSASSALARQQVRTSERHQPSVASNGLHPVAEAGPEGRGAAGLVTSETTQKATPRKPSNGAGLRPIDGVQIMGPEWGHESPNAEVQSTAPDGPHGRSQSPSRSPRRFAQCLLPVRDCGAGQTHPQAAAGACGALPQASNKADTASQGRAKRPLSLRQRTQGQAVPPGDVLTGGVA